MTAEPQGQILADLNQNHDPDDLSHYVKVSRMDGFILGDVERVTALCGYSWIRGEDQPDVNTYARGRAPERQVCADCSDRYSAMAGGAL